jgi:hypothetical protein
MAEEGETRKSSSGNVRKYADNILPMVKFVKFIYFMFENALKFVYRREFGKS